MGWTEYEKKLKEWYGYSEAKNQDDIIIDIYNSQRPAGSYKMTHTDPWCHATVSAAAYASGNAGKVPNTCYCPTGINIWKKWGKWVGRYTNAYNPQPGYIIYYDWNKDLVSDHVGTIIARNGNILTVREGNRNDMLCDRQINVNSPLIIGYGIPDWGGATKAPVATVPTHEETKRTWLQIGDAGAVAVSAPVNTVPKPATSSAAKPATHSGNDWVRRLQKECNAQGFSKQVVDGIPGKNTLAGCPTCRKGARGNITRLIQERLNSLGFNCGAIDGIFGSGTENAVKALQKVYGRIIDGIVGQDTWRVLLGM